jgi:hypothetical protein
MSVQIKNLTSVVTPRNADTRADDPGVGVKFNRIPLDGNIYDLYAAPNSTTAKKTAILKSLRVTNTHDAPVVIDLYYADDVIVGTMVSTNLCRRRRIAPPLVRLAVGFTYIEDGEVTVEPGGRIQASAKPETGAVQPTKYIDYVISGVERDAI